LHDHTVTVSACGRICFACKKINLSQAFAGQKVGIKEEEDGIWQVSFKDYEIGHFDLDTCRVEPVYNPFGAKVLAVSIGHRNTGCKRWMQEQGESPRPAAGRPRHRN